MTDTQKNIVAIAIDDLFAYDQFRTAFGVTISTPNLDRLMAQSINFENAYASVAICAPSRAATMTGKSVYQNGVHDNFTGLFDQVDPAETWPAMIRDAGYYAASSGKVFHSKGGTAEIQSVYSEPVAVTKTTLDRDQRVATDGGKTWAYAGPDEDFNDYDVAQFGIEFLDRAPADQPFLLTLGFDHPHTSYFAPERFFDLYPADRIQVPETWVQGDLSDAPAFAQQFVSQPRGGEPWSDLAEWTATVQGYLAAISHMDAEIGRFLDALAGSGHADTTAVLVYSDHGYQLGNKDHPVKFTLWEEAAKAPMMLYDPSLETGQTVSAPVSLMDIMPTLLEIAGAEPPADLIGQSLLPFAEGRPEDYTATSALTMMYGSFAIRMGEYRYIRYNDGSEELYNLTTDPGQITNLASDPAEATRLDGLRAELVSEAVRAGALMDLDVAILRGTDGADSAVAQPGNVEIALGQGDDIYFVHGTGTLLTEAAGEGIDTVYYVGTETYTLPDNVEIFRTTLPDNRTGLVSANGNDLDNEMYTGYYSASFDAGAGNDTLFGGGWVEHTLIGGAGHDRIVGGKFADSLVGGTGDDSISGFNKNDRIFGGAGQDRISGDNDNDLIDAGADDDQVWGGAGRDHLIGGSGDDSLSGGDGGDRIFGGTGADHLTDGAGDDTLDGGDGDDVLTASGGGTVLIGGAGSDRLVLGPVAGHMIADLTGDDGTDTIEIARPVTEATLYVVGPDLHVWFSEASSVWIENGAVRPVRVLFADTDTSGAALAAGATPLDAPLAGYGDETLGGTGYGEVLSGNYGRDQIAAKAGDDTLEGGAGADLLNAAAGNDLLDGGTGDDTLWGGSGSDALTGGPGDDILQGAQGGDTYHFAPGFGRDILDDKGSSAGDRVIFARALDTAAITAEGSTLTVTFDNGDRVEIRRSAQEGDQGAIEQFRFAATDLALGDMLRLAAGGDPGAFTPPSIVQGTDAGEALSGGGGADQVISRGGDDTLAGAGANDKLFGGAGADTLSDGAGVDNLFGGAGADLFVLSADGDVDALKDFEAALDRIDLSAWGATGLADLTIQQTASGKVNVRFGPELMSIDDGSQTMQAADLTAAQFIFAAAQSVLTGTAGADLLIGLSGGESLFGGAGDDKLFGKGGADLLSDGAGVDNLFGGAGADIFALGADGTVDSIKDFEIGVDRIDLSGWGVTRFAEIDIQQSTSGKVNIRFGAELLSVDDGTQTLNAADVGSTSFMFRVDGPVLMGGGGDDRLIGTALDETLIDGAGQDKMWGRAGADTFVLGLDGQTDFVQDFELGIDLIDISAWGAGRLGDLTITQKFENELRVRYDGEFLIVRAMDGEPLDGLSFVFA